MTAHLGYISMREGTGPKIVLNGVDITDSVRSIRIEQIVGERAHVFLWTLPDLIVEVDLEASDLTIRKLKAGR